MCNNLCVWQCTPNKIHRQSGMKEVANTSKQHQVDLNLLLSIERKDGRIKRRDRNEEKTEKTEDEASREHTSMDTFRETVMETKRPRKTEQCCRGSNIEMD